jgi:hypothetical protein
MFKIKKGTPFGIPFFPCFISLWFFPPITVKKKFVLQIVAICMVEIEAYFFDSVLLVEKSQNALQGHQEHVLGSDFCPIKRFHLVLNKMCRMWGF